MAVMTAGQRSALKRANRLSYLFDLWKQLRDWNMQTTGIATLDEEIRLEWGDWHDKSIKHEEPKSDFPRYLTKCDCCGKTTSITYAKSHRGLCKTCVENS